MMRLLCYIPDEHELKPVLAAEGAFTVADGQIMVPEGWGLVIHRSKDDGLALSAIDFGVGAGLLAACQEAAESIAAYHNDNGGFNGVIGQLADSIQAAKNPHFHPWTNVYDARLLSAAPDLLEACKLMDDAIVGSDNTPELSRAVGMMRRAIEKAGWSR